MDKEKIKKKIYSISEYLAEFGAIGLKYIFLGIGWILYIFMLMGYKIYNLSYTYFEKKSQKEVKKNKQKKHKGKVKNNKSKKS